VKVNHALVLGGVPGIGKDTILEPVKHAVGPWNFVEVKPQQAMGRFNGFLKSVILRISEAHDLGDVNRFQFYEHVKDCIASPPDVLRIDEKNLREYSIMNVTGVVITTNHKTDGLFLPPDDRRHFVAWSELAKSHFTPDEWSSLWAWYEQGGYQDIAAYLGSLTFQSSTQRRRRRRRKPFGRSPMRTARPRTPSSPMFSTKWGTLRRSSYRVSYGRQAGARSPDGCATARTGGSSRTGLNPAAMSRLGTAPVKRDFGLSIKPAK
jgi:Family of unknown function (DUF5906)